MADARALLRAHRAANRIEHPYAAYSDAGKLLCKLCHENIKSETLWDGHLRSAGHRDKHAALQPPQPQQQQQLLLQQQQEQQQQPQPPQSQPPPGPATNHKRKLDDAAADDDEMGDAAPAAAEDSVRTKRSRTDMVAAPAAATAAGISIQTAGDKPAAAAAGGGGGGGGTTTPPALSRQPSGTPAHGVELAIPSRPATPSLGEGSQSSTPRLANAHVRSPLATSGSESASTPHGPAATVETRIAAAARGATPPGPLPADGRPPAARTVDEAEWAAFEAEIADAAEPTPPPPEAVPQPGSGAAAALFSGPGTIAAPALTAEQVAAKSADEEHERRKLLSDAQLADEREDATRALEDEFDEMEELESRVRRLKARREALRLAHQRAAADGNAGAAAPADGKKITTTTTGGPLADKENRGAAARAEGESDDDEEDDDDDEDWDDGFRFRA